MKKRTVFAIVTCIALLLGTSVYALDLQKGVLDYQWSDSTSKYSGLSKLNEKGDVSYYTKPGEVFTIGNVAVERIIYGFHKDKLFGVYINIDSIDIYEKLFEHMKSLYGTPTYKTTAANQPIYKWKQQDVTIKLKMDKAAQKMKLAFYYRPISSTINSSEWEDLDTDFFHFTPIEKKENPDTMTLFEF